jgi:hypothetical protein
MSFELLMKRLLKIMAERIYIVSYHLNLDSQKMEIVWKLVKQTVVEQTKTLEDIHLDIIIVCMIYGVCKLFKPAAKKFKDVLEA